MRGVGVRELSKRYGDTVAVDDLTIDFDGGTLSTLLGPSGCGKTTTLRCIAGLEKPEKGEISINGQVVFSAETNLPPEKRKIGIVFQSYAIWPHMTVFDNIAFPLKIRHASSQEIQQKVKKTMELVRLGGLGDRSATQVSGGQQQRIALARALVFDPEVLLLDEPLSNLDASLRDIVRVEVREIQRSLGITTIYVTHDQVEALSISDEVVVLRAGKIMAVGTPREIYTRPPNEFTASFVGKANILPGVVVSMPGEPTARSGEELVIVETKFGRVRCHLHGAVQVNEGDKALVTIKPENVVVVSTDGPKSQEANTFPGRVEFTSYLGAFSEVIVSVGGEKIRALKKSEETAFEAGSQVSVSFPEHYCSLLRLD
ncbi:MAG: ABC transporter ATP-binding protein [Thaumarchaeota archaeon]|nr:ABC transporter ATP-binding protein [Nitrososphaerota archaeon]